MEVKEIIKPNIISGFDLAFSSSLGLFLEDSMVLSFLGRRLGKGLITITIKI